MKDGSEFRNRLKSTNLTDFGAWCKSIEERVTELESRTLELAEALERLLDKLVNL